MAEEIFGDPFFPYHLHIFGHSPESDLWKCLESGRALDPQEVLAPPPLQSESYRFLVQRGNSPCTESNVDCGIPADLQATNGNIIISRDNAALPVTSSPCGDTTTTAL
ncbi:hypothetical protein TNIN_128081 [Trichonephila inaurata madagascariensis]|uniref:Uncharacterized protein n=1 Tax=Trichonephila inaurata madagascariensis TaxID=2747483 RepID=A0A8X7C5B9_9ARAC|nr:hypothetical protein TNIN_128081 [Trichonephila inaurata madagascariensis]